jgi:predicted Ser/Thr protein kinase
MMTTVFHRVGAYEILHQIGSGGMAVVFLASDTRTNRQVALKLVSIEDDQDGREIIEAERLGTRLQEAFCRESRYVPTVFEYGTQDKYFFIAMEYLDGQNLSDVIRGGALPPDRAVRIAIQLCEFLETAIAFKMTLDGEERGALLHGDLKPRNIRVLAGDEIKVFDFGIAKALSLSRKVTRNDFGSMPYLSPERLDSTDVDAHADLWALGVILYELLSGAPPFHGLDTRRLEQQIRAGYQRRPLEAPCPVALQAMVARLLAPRQADRYASADAVLADLRLVQSGQPTEAEARGFPGNVDEAPTRRTQPPAPADTEATRRTRPAAAAPPPPLPRAAAAKPATARPARSHRVRTSLMLAALLLACNELAVGFGARRAAASAMTRDLDAMDGVWAQYAGLSQRSYLRFGVLRLERVLETRVETLAEQVMANYRSALPTVRERQWRTAQTNLQQALILSPDNRRLRAALRYCEGHLHRIDGEAEKARRRIAAANQHFTEAVAAFREAAELRRDWPDPFLGLARTFIYGLEDIDRAADAMRQAQKSGYSTGDRETAQLGDGYRSRGDALWQTARGLADLPQEAEYLLRATQAYKQALGLYERVPGFAGVGPNLRRTRRALDQIETRISELESSGEEPAFLSPPWR